MPRGPVDSRSDSHVRAARAAQMRGSGATWQQVADREGYRTRRGAQLAVQRHHEREAGSTLLHRRHDADEGYRIIQQVLFTELAEARGRGDSQTVITTARTITDTIDKRVRLAGLAVPVTQQVDVSVHTSASAILDRAEADLLALAQRQPHQLEVIEGEVVA